MSDPSGPFAVPNFSQVERPEDDGPVFELDEYEADEFDGDAVDDELDEEGDGVVAEPPRAQEIADAPDSSEPVDGGVAQAVLEHIARSIVDDPDAVRVVVSGQRDGVRLDLHVAPSDMGRIIGRRGRVAQALRSVVRAAAAKDGKDATVDIVD
jgi:predicted RNA-binding protein YlqC (UPF0109 family)